MKSVGYLRANWLSEQNLSPLKDPKKYLLTEVVLSGESDIFCGYCPEWKHVVQDICAKIDLLNSSCEKIYEKIKNWSRRDIS